MKKVVRTAAMIALIFATTTGIANDGKLSLISKENTKSLVFEMESKAGSSDIKLVDMNNNIIYTESIRKSEYSKKFDLSNLEEGLYYFTTEDALRAITYTLKVDRADVTILDEKEKIKPVFKEEKDILYVNYLNLDKSNVDVEVYNSEDTLIFSEKRENQMTIAKAINFKKAIKGNYTVVVKDSDGAYYKNVVVN